MNFQTLSAIENPRSSEYDTKESPLLSSHQTAHLRPYLGSKPQIIQSFQIPLIIQIIRFTLITLTISKNTSLCQRARVHFERQCKDTTSFWRDGK